MMKLKGYRSRRRFGKTPEPRGEEGIVPDLRTARSGAPSPDDLIFVVQKHAARALHYDLRLELEGVLKSWAVPKGPSLDPSVKRLAVMVEDHPFEYKDFEGVIPKGNYGAGNVVIWDRGVYRHPAARDRKSGEKLLLEGLRKGDLKFVLEGERLRGEFALIKTGWDEKSWLLLKKKDRYATTEGIPGGDEDLMDAPSRPMPRNIRPMLSTLAKGPFDHPDWIFEVKWDGYRAIAELHDDKVSLYSRNRVLLDKKFPAVAESLRKSGIDAVLDGEIVVVDDAGRSDFQLLQNYSKSGSGHLLYYVFDLLYYDGHDLTGLPLLKRKELLKKILQKIVFSHVRFSDHVLKEGVLFFNAAKERGLEGIMAKHSQSVYLPGRRSRKWLKVKTRLTQDGVIAGFTAPGGGRRYFGSLVLGSYEGRKLVYIGHSGGGFTQNDLREIYKKLEPLIRKECPFDPVPETGGKVTWVKPELVCEVAFQGWTDEGLMRQPVFLRLREDKTAGKSESEEPFGEE